MIDTIMRIDALDRTIERLTAIEMPRKSKGARAGSFAAHSIPSGVSTVVNFEQVSYDPDGCITIGAAWKYTAQETGTYALAVCVLFDSSVSWASNEFLQYDILVNGVTNWGGRREYTTGARTLEGIGGTCLITMNTGDYVQVLIYQASGAAIPLINDSRFTHISIWRI